MLCSREDSVRKLQTSNKHSNNATSFKTTRKRAISNVPFVSSIILCPLCYIRFFVLILLSLRLSCSFLIRVERKFEQYC